MAISSPMAWVLVGVCMVGRVGRGVRHIRPHGSRSQTRFDAGRRVVFLWRGSPMETAANPAEATPGASGAQPPVYTVGLRLGDASKAAAGLKAVEESMAFTVGEMGLVRGVSALLRLNQKDGFDCQS